jgi:hypothetical protein
MSSYILLVSVPAEILSQKEFQADHYSLLHELLEEHAEKTQAKGLLSGGNATFPDD